MKKLFLSREFKIFLTIFIVYAYFIHWTGYAEISILSLVRAVVDENRFEIDSYYNQTTDRNSFGNHYYTHKGPGISFLSTPIYAIWRSLYTILFSEQIQMAHSGSNEYKTRYANNIPIYDFINPGFFVLASMILVTISTSSLFSALSVVLIYKITKYLTKNKSTRLLITVLYGLGSLMFPYALVYLSHATGTFFIFLSFYLLFKIKQEKLENPAYFFLSGFSMSFASTIEFSTIIISVLIFLYALTLKQRKKLIYLIVGGFIGLLPLLAYNSIVYYNPLEFTIKYLDPEIWYPVQSSIWHRGPITLDNIMPNIYIMYRLAIDPYRGLFFYYPVLIFSLLGLWNFSKKFKIEALLIILVLIIFLSVFSTRYDWWGGAVFGAKHLLPITPFIILPLYYFLESKYKFLVYLFVVISILVNIVGLQNVEDVFRADDIVIQRFPIRQNSFETIYNPLLEHYLPLFFQYGPRSRIFENILNGEFVIDIRDFPLSKGENFPFNKIFIPFLSLLPISILVFIIWLPEIKENKLIIRK